MNSNTAYANQRYYRDVQNTSVVGEPVTLDLFFGDWTDSNVISLLTSYILPIKIDYIDKLHVALWTYNSTQRGHLKCSVHDMNCMATRLLSCIVEPFHTNASTDVPLEGEDMLPRRHMLPTGEEGGKILSFSACIMQTLSNSSRGNENVVLSVKRCVRYHRYDWTVVRTCVLRDALQTDTNDDEGISESDAEIAFEMAVNEKPVEPSSSMALSLCLSLNKEGITPIICSLYYDELENEAITDPEHQLLSPESEGYPDELKDNMGSFVVDIIKNVELSDSETYISELQTDTTQIID